MEPIVVAAIVLTCLLCGALADLFLARYLPETHLSHESREVVKLGIGLVATMSALVLGLVTASAKNFFDSQETAVKQIGADLISLDRLLFRYGPETGGIRASLQQIVDQRVALTWPKGNAPAPALDEMKATADIENIEERIRGLAAANDTQRWLQARALEASGGLLKSRWLVQGSEGNEVPTPFLVVLVLWLTIIFMSFGLYAPRNATVVAMFIVCSLSFSAGIFLILEMNLPYEGLMRVSEHSLAHTLRHLGQ